MHDDAPLDPAAMLAETRVSRSQAAALLDELLDAKLLSEQNLAQINQADLVKKVTGRSSLDNAIESTRRLLATYDRLLTDLEPHAAAEPDAPAIVGVVGPARPALRLRG